MKKTVFAVPIILLCGLGAALAATQDEALQAEKNWAAVTTKADYATLDTILHPDLIYTHSAGTIENKEVFFGSLKSGALKYESFEYESTTVNAYGDSAVISSKVRMKGLSGGRPFEVHAAIMHVWVKQAGSWKLVAHQATRLPN